MSIFFFCSVFKLLQNETIYSHTIGLVSKNYERTGDWNSHKITKVSKPYIKVENDVYLHWDAAIYNCIKEHNYSANESCFSKVRAAFFPLFPALWKMTSASPIAISVLNYLLFITALFLLLIRLLPNNLYVRATTFILFATLPTNVIYMIPYSESLFMLCMTIAAIGILDNKYKVYFIGALLLAMVRPATVFVWLAIIATEGVFLCKERNVKQSFAKLILKSLPFLLGYFLVIAYQRISSGSWNSFIDAQKYWSGGFQKINQISDWSSEGFGMNTFAIFFVALPAVLYISYLGVNLLSKKATITTKISNTQTNYLGFISLFYMAGILVFSLLTSGGNFHSLFRFIICSPLFYIAAFIFISKIPKLNSTNISKVFAGLCVLVFLYIFTVKFGGSGFRFSFVGLLLLITTFAYLLYRRFLPVKLDLILLSICVLLNTVWNTYMLNMYLCNGWIFT
ncbi:hypothetical protein N8939_00215 [bacterium]|nr:hypothetical protein [bacterium]